MRRVGRDAHLKPRDIAELRSDHAVEDDLAALKRQLGIEPIAPVRIIVDFAPTK